MNCTDIQPLLHAYTDRELDLLNYVEVEHHLKECPACSAAQRGIQSLRSNLSSGALYHRAPAQLREQLSRQFGVESRPRLRRVSPPWMWIALGTAAVFMVLGTPWIAGRREKNLLADEIVSEHVRSLMVDHLMDVASSDQHTVKPWFDGKLDFAPPVKDLADHGYPLRGGRLDYLDGRPVAALVYQHGGHWINVFIQPAEGPGVTTRKASVRQGYNLLTWSTAGMRFHAVSDLNAHELGEFAELLD